MHWKGNCARPLVRNVRSVVNKVILYGNSEGAKVHMVEEEFYTHSISGQDQAFLSLTVNDSASVTFQIDTGSTANILPLQDYIRLTNDYSKARIVPKDITVVMHDHSRRKALGFARMKVEHNGSKHELKFVIVDQKVTPLLGLQSSKGMGLIKILVSSANIPINNVIESESSVECRVSRITCRVSRVTCRGSRVEGRGSHVEGS